MESKPSGYGRGKEVLVPRESKLAGYGRGKEASVPGESKLVEYGTEKIIKIRIKRWEKDEQGKIRNPWRTVHFGNTDE